jgi:hypothetical protein
MIYLLRGRDYIQIVMSQFWPGQTSKSLVLSLDDISETSWRKIKRYALREWPAIIDAHSNAASRFWVAHAETGAKWQRSMSGGEAVWIEFFA